MDIQTLTQFFMWCTIINATMFALAVLMCSAAGNFVYRTQTALFPMSRETFTVVIYSFFGLYKLLIILFNFTPLIALLIIR